MLFDGDELGRCSMLGVSQVPKFGLSLFSEFTAFDSLFFVAFMKNDSNCDLLFFFERNDLVVIRGSAELLRLVIFRDP